MKIHAPLLPLAFCLAFGIVAGEFLSNWTWGLILSLLSGIWHCGWRIPQQLDMGTDSTSDNIGSDRLVGSLSSLAISRYWVLRCPDWNCLKFQNQTTVKRRMARQTNGD